MDVGLARKLRDSLKVGAVREDFHGQVQQAFSHPFQPTQRPPPNASSSQRPASLRTAGNASLKIPPGKRRRCPPGGLLTPPAENPPQPAARGHPLTTPPRTSTKIPFIEMV